jgi:PAS domain S-box-containing protein
MRFLDRLHLPRIPQQPLARFRLLSVGFAAGLAFLNAGLFAVDPRFSTLVRWEEVAAAMLLGTWWLYVYVRGGSPIVGWLVDMGLVLVVAVLSPMPADAIGLFFAGIQFRGLITPRRQLPVLIASYGTARVMSTMIWYAHGSLTYGPLSTSSIVSVLGLTLIAVSLSLFAEATERHDAAARELARSDERYRLIARATRDVVYDWHVASGRIEWTESMHAVFGYAPDQVGDGAWWLDRVHPDDRDALQRSVEAVAADPAVSVGTVHYRVRRADGRYAHVSGSMIVQRAPDGTAERVIGSIRDVTSEHLLEERLRRAQKMEAVGQLAGGVAHDFNNLLTVIGGHVYMLEVKRGESLKERDLLAAKHLAGITRAADRAAALTRQLLAFGRKQLLTPTIVELNAVVDDVLQMMRPAIGERITIVTRLEPALWPVYADAGQLGQVLVNLALNARDAMPSPSGGTLTIETANTTIEDSVDARSADTTSAPLSPGDYVRLTVRDTGTGMDTTTLARAFEPFFTTKPHGQGTGLGLATVYGIVKQSFGDIQIDSVPGSGSSLTIHLPVAPVERRRVKGSSDAADDSAKAWTDITPTFGHRGVLLVEDDDGIRQFAMEVLTRAGFSVLTARGGVEAIEQMRRYEDSIDIVVTDIVMPEMGGRELIEQLRERRRDLAVLYITGYTDDAGMLDELKATDARLLEKPFTAGALAEAVAGLCAPTLPSVARAS